MLSLQALNAVLNICLWFLHALSANILEKIYIHCSKLEFRATGKTFSMDSGELNILRGFQSLRDKLFCCSSNSTGGHLPSTWVFFLICLSLIYYPAEVWFETGIDERNDCHPRKAVTTGLCSSEWNGHSGVGIANAALLVQKSEWIDSNWDIIYEGSSVNMNLSDVHRIEYGRSILSDEEANMLEAQAVARECTVEIQNCVDCGFLTVAKDGGAFDTIITNASIVDDPDRCRRINQSDRNPCRGDLTYDTATGLAFFFWSVRSDGNSKERRVATKGIEVLLTEKEIETVLSTNESVWEIHPDESRSRVYSISCASRGLHWTDLTRAVSFYRTVQMERPGEKKVNVNGNLTNVRSLTRDDVLKSIFALKAEDITSNCEGLVPQYTQCGAFNLSKASLLVAVSCCIVLIYASLRVAAFGVRDVSFPVNTSSWKKYTIGTFEEKDVPRVDFMIAIEHGSSSNRLVAIDMHAIRASLPPDVVDETSW